jgi:hypothetical protein
MNRIQDNKDLSSGMTFLKPHMYHSTTPLPQRGESKRPGQLSLHRQPKYHRSEARTRRRCVYTHCEYHWLEATHLPSAQVVGPVQPWPPHCP